MIPNVLKKRHRIRFKSVTVNGQLPTTNGQRPTAITGWMFLVTALGTILITLLTVSYQSIKAALTNPVNSLRSE